MKELVLFIDGRTVGPFTPEEVEARLASGEVSADTPCAEAGAEEWKTLADFVPAAKKNGVRIARKTQAEVEEMKTATSEKLDPDVRKKLLLYNLADSISVDKFTPVQAAAAIEIYEAALKKGKKLKIAAGAGAFVLSAGLAYAFVDCVPVGTGPGGQSQKIFEKVFFDPPNPDYAKTAKRIASETEKLREVRAEAASARFSAPKGQGSPRQTFLSNVVIENPDISTVTGTVDKNSLAQALSPALLEAATFEVVQLPRVDGAVEELIRAQDETFAYCSKPLWTEKELRAAIARDLAPEFPLDPNVPESAEFIKNLRAFRLGGIEAQLARLVKRTGELARSPEVSAKLQSAVQAKLKEAPELPDPSARKAEKRREPARAEQNGASAADKIGRTSAWAANRLAPFMERFAEWLKDNEIYYSPEARAAVWGAFAENELPKIEEAAAKSVHRVPVAADGSFVLDGRNPRGLLVVAHFSGRAGDVWFVPETEDGDSAAPLSLAIRDLKINRRTLTPEDVLMDERYVVAEKEKTGGVPLATSGKLMGKEIFIVRTSPEWFFVTMEKVPAPGSSSARKPKVLLGVPAEFFDSVEVGDEVPMEKLLTFERFGRVAESSGSGRLIPISPDKLEAVREQQTEAGIPFPPPPEKYSPPQPENARPAPEKDVPADEDAPDAAEAADAPAEEPPEPAPSEEETD